MKITSQFTDYYDHAVGPDMQDPSIRYIRMPSWENYPTDRQFPVLPWDQELVSRYTKRQKIGRMTASMYVEMEVEARLDFPNHERKEDLHFSQGILLVAGKAYPVWLRDDIELSRKSTMIEFQGYPDFPQMSNDLDWPRRDCLPYGCPNLQDFKDGIRRHFENHPKVLSVKPYTPRTTRFSLLSDEDKVVQHDLHMTQFCQQDHNGFMFKLQVPVALIVPPKAYKAPDSHFNEHTLLIKNPPLRAFQFFKQMDQFTCWQEISMWIGGVMPGRQSPMVEIGDDSKIKKHGFDPVMGFRKRKQGTK